MFCTSEPGPPPPDPPSHPGLKEAPSPSFPQPSSSSPSSPTHSIRCIYLTCFPPTPSCCAPCKNSLPSPKQQWGSQPFPPLPTFRPGGGQRSSPVTSPPLQRPPSLFTQQPHDPTQVLSFWALSTQTHPPRLTHTHTHRNTNESRPGQIINGRNHAVCNTHTRAHRTVVTHKQSLPLSLFYFIFFSDASAKEQRVSQDVPE